MDKFEKAIDRYQKQFSDKLNRTDIDTDLLIAISKYLGPSIYSPDASKVACAKSKERNAIKTNFLIKKLKLKDTPALDEAIKEVCATMGSSNRSKYRAVFYYLLVEKFEKQSVFGKTEKKTAAPKSGPSASVKDSSTEDQAKSAPKTSASTSGKTSSSSSSKKSTGRNMAPDMIIERHALYAAGGGLIPIPLIDLVSISTVQYKMIKKLAEQYDHVSFDSTRAQSFIAAFMGGVSSFELGIFSRILFKGIPIFGSLIGGAVTASFAYYSTKAIGELFDDHFRSGGDMSIEERTFERMKSQFNWLIRDKKKKTA